MHGYDRDYDTNQMSSLDFYVNADQRKEFVEKLKSDGYVTGFETELRHKDGSVVTISIDGVLFTDENGAPIYVDGTAEDITERKQAQERLRLLSSITEQSTEGVALVDLEGNLQFVNKAFAEMHDYSQEELLGKNLSIFHTPEQMPIVEAINRQIKEIGKFSGEVWHVRRDGSVFLSYMSNSLMYDDNGQAVAIIGTILDLTELKTAEERFRLTAEATADMIYEWDIANDKLEWFGGLDDVLGYAPGKIERTIEGWVQLIHPDDLERLRDSVERHRTSTEQINEEYRMRREDGSWSYWLDRGRPILGSDGKPVKWIGACTDITNRKKVEERLRFLSLITQQVTDSIVTTDLDFKITYVNQAFLSLYGYSREEILGQTPEILDAETDWKLIMRDINQAVSSGTSWSGVVQSRRKDGTTFPCDLLIFPLVDSQGVVFAYTGIQRDITERKESEKQLREAGEKLKAEHEAQAKSNIALQQILDHIEKERLGYKQRICSQVEQAISPLLARLKKDSSPQRQKDLKSLEENLNVLLSKEIDVFETRYAGLTPRENEICEFIKQGLSSKEIADMLSLSILTIHKHRELIRKKLKITNKAVNLSTFLRNDKS